MQHKTHQSWKLYFSISSSKTAVQKNVQWFHAISKVIHLNKTQLFIHSCTKMLGNDSLLDVSSYYKSSSVCLSVCLFVPLLLRGPLTDLRQTWWMYVGEPRKCPWGVNGSMGQGVKRHFFGADNTRLRPHRCKRHGVFCLPSKRRTASKSLIPWRRV